MVEITDKDKVYKKTEDLKTKFVNYLKHVLRARMFAPARVAPDVVLGQIWILL